MKFSSLFLNTFFNRIILVLAIGLLHVGCATIVRDDSQPVSFSSEPQGATVSLNGVPRGVTPTTIMVPRQRKEVMVQMDLAGYRSESFSLDKSVAAMTFGNILFGGIIGVGVDYATGKGSNYEDSVHVELVPLDAPVQPFSAPSDQTEEPPIEITG